MLCPKFSDFEVYLKTKIDKASQIDPMMMHIHQTTSEKGFPNYHHHHHHQNVRTNGVPHNQFGQQPLRPGFVLPPKYMSREEYSSVKSIADSVYFTPLTNGTSHLGGAAAGGGEDENMSQKSIQGTPIHINYLPESLDIPEDIQMMYHEMKPLEGSSEGRQSKRREKIKPAAKSSMGDDGLWSDNPERLCGGGGGDAAAEEMMMRMSFGLGNLDEDTSEILFHELIQKKLKRDRRNRMRFYDERRRQERLRAAGANVVAEQGMIEGNSSGHAHGVGGGLGDGGLALLPKFRGKGSSRRPVLASAMDPEFLRLMNGGDKGIPLHDDNRRTIRNDYHQRTAHVPPPTRVVAVNEDEGVQQQKPQKKCSNGDGMKADILYHSISVEPEASTSRALAGGVGHELGAKPKRLAEQKPIFNGWHHREQDTEEEDDDDEDGGDAGDRFSQRQMFTSKSLPEISRKRGGRKRRNKDNRVAVEGEEEESGALLGVSSATAAKSSIQMATIETPPRPPPLTSHLEQQTANTINSNFTATGSKLMNCENSNNGAGRGGEDEVVIETESVGGVD